MLRRLYNIEFLSSGEASILEMLTPSITEMMTTHSIDAIEKFELFILDIVNVLRSHLPNQYESIVIRRKQSFLKLELQKNVFVMT